MKKALYLNVQLIQSDKALALSNVVVLNAYNRLNWQLLAHSSYLSYVELAVVGTLLISTIG